MKRTRTVAVLFFLCSSFCNSQAPPNLRAIAAPFLQPGAAIVQMEAHSNASGQTEKPKLAIFKTSLSGEQSEIVFAQSIQLSDGGEKVVTIQLLRAYAGVYRSVFSESYYDHFIEDEGSGTSGLQEVTLSGQKKALLVITSSGASLGGNVELYQWQDGLGLVNLLPSGPGGAHYFKVSEKKEGLRIQLDYCKGPGRTDCPPPDVLVWRDDEQKMEIVKGKSAP